MNKLQLKALEFFDEGYLIAGANVDYKDLKTKKDVKGFAKWKDISDEQTEEDVIEMFKDGKPWNTIAIKTGETSNLTVIDIDTDEHGNLKANPLDFEETYSIKTPSGGVHLYYKYSPIPKQTQGLKTSLGEIDIRNDGGVVFAYALWKGQELYSAENIAPLSDSPDYLFATQSPKGTYQHTILDDLVYVSERPELHNRNITLFNYYLTELNKIPNQDEFAKVLEDTLNTLSNIKTAEPISSIKATFNSVKKFVLENRKNMDTKEIKAEARRMSQKETQEYFQRIEEYFIRENDNYVLYNLKENSYIYKWDSQGFYERQTKTDVKSMLSQFIKEKNLYQYNKDNFHNEVYNRLVTHLNSLPNRHFSEVSQKINLQNGYFDLKTKELKPHTKDVFSIQQLPFKYNSEAKEMPLFQAYLDLVSKYSPNLNIMLQELTGYILSEGNPRQAVHFLYGEKGGDGKSVFWKILKKLLGDENVSNVSLESFKPNDFSLEQLVNKKLNISDETHRNYIDSPVFTSLSAEGELTVNPKGEKGYNHTVKASFLIVGNFLPKFRDAVGMKRRFIILPYKHQITEDEKILGLEDKIEENNELAAIFNWAVKGYERIEENNGFYRSEFSQEDQDTFEELINPVLDFVKNACELDTDSVVHPKDLYGITEFRNETGYNKFIKDSGKNPLDFKNFKQDLKNVVESNPLLEWGATKKIDGKTVRGVKGLKLITSESQDDFNNFN